MAAGVSFLCSVMEAVLLSVTPSYVVAKAVAGEGVGKWLRILSKDEKETYPRLFAFKVNHSLYTSFHLYKAIASG